MSSGLHNRKRDFLKLADLTTAEYRVLYKRTAELKRARAKRQYTPTLAGRTLVTIFEKHSTRTRVSFEAAIGQLGGHAVDLSLATSQLSRGEPLVDTARIIGRYADIVVMRTHSGSRLLEFARACEVPVINGLSDDGHPVQVLADIFTISERRGGVVGRSIAFLGDSANNMGLSFVEAATIFGFSLRLGSPVGYRPPDALLADAGAAVQVFADPGEAVRGADVIVTDVWTSMGQEKEAETRLKALQPYQVNAALMAQAGPDALFFHCLPAHRGEEVTAEVIDGRASAVWDEAENRLHVQKALIELLLGVNV